ncbi:MAG: hypothetical protein FVQ80_01335 [Planctomycetes bacterium]|nr:hypothetical protein [Planctomycetota bacterium]
MAIYSDGIDNVRVFELPAGIWGDGQSFDAPRTALVKWRSSYSDKFYQVYVNGLYSGTTLESGQRQLIVQLPSSFSVAARIEVLAVDAGDFNKDFSNEFENFISDSGRVRVKMLRGQQLSINSVIEIYSNGGNGAIDYSEPVSDSPIQVWSSWQDKDGFGMSCFGGSDFGYDGAAAVGLGKGSFGYGQFGFDADSFDWISSQLGKGVYKFGVKIIDEIGNEDVVETEDITVIPAAIPAEHLSVASFDKVTNQLVLKIF